MIGNCLITDHKPKSQIKSLDWDQAWEEFAADPIVIDRDANESKLKRKILLWRDYLQFTGQGIYINRSTKKEDIRLFATKEDDESLKSSLEKAVGGEISPDMFEQKLNKIIDQFLT